ncbi:MAG TPA: ankyrin repeat domain-containing protein [Luteibacter sp.]|uniref:ankyrin repeat domain-containing protein n=1 Tax=Luteibacter sp. TaxID=1886636 RepID=UPI002F42F678
MIGAVGTYLLCPQVRLWAHAVDVTKLSTVQRVDASTYDPEWFDAARAGRIDILQALHDAHYPIDRQNASGYTAVILAAYDKQPAALDYLLSAGANPCIADHNGNSALMGAIYKGHEVEAQRLMRSGCPIDQTNKAGETALAFAVLFGRKGLVEDLFHLGARLDSRDAHGQTPMAIASKQGDVDMLRVLSDLGATN